MSSPPDGSQARAITRLHETPAPDTTNTLLYVPSRKEFAMSSIPTLICPPPASPVDSKSRGAPDRDRVSCFATCRPRKEDGSSRAEKSVLIIIQSEKGGGVPCKVGARISTLAREDQDYVRLTYRTMQVVRRDLEVKSV